MQRVLLLVVWAAAGLSAQTITYTPGQTAVPVQGRGGVQLQPAAPLRPEDACTLEGKTVNSATGAPVKWANVTLQGGVPGGGRGGAPAYYTTTANGEGVFAMKNLPPGRYSIRAERSGFSATSAPMTTLTTGQRMTGLEVKLQPGAVIAGRVMDEHGEPAARATVMTMKYSYAQGGKQLVAQAGATTNDLGEYRAFGLMPGRYYVGVTYRPSVYVMPSAEDRSAAPVAEESYTTTYYPGATDMQSAVQVDAAAGAVVESINLQLAKSPAVRVRGSVASPSGAAVAYAMVTMARIGDMGANTLSSTGASVIQGQFEIRGVTPGRYALIAMGNEGQKQLQARQIVEVGSANVENVMITLGAGFDLTGKIRVDGQTPVALLTLSIYVQTAEPSAGNVYSQSAKVDAEGNFTLTGVSPGRYSVRVQGPANIYVKSQRLGSEDVLETPLDLTGGAAGPLSIVLGTDTGEVSGTVSSADGTPAANAMVVLIPESAKRREQQQFYKMTMTSPAGAYKVAGAPPGRYKLYAWERIPTYAWMDPDILKPVESNGKAVEIQEGSKDTVDLRALPPVE
jgi:protocatechuate 3,4-dioxygenase beta subunit